MSRYKNTPTRDFYLDLWQNIDVPVSSDDKLQTITAKYVNRPDLLSYDLYGTVKYWWVFALRNKDKIIDPIFDMKEGVEIYVVSQSVVASL